MDGVFAAVGFVLLFAGGELVVRGGVGLARRLSLSPLIIGLVVVGFATSAPELVVSLSAALEGQPQLAVGNIVGSTIANLLLILGAAALIRPLALRRTGLGQAAVMAVAVGALVAAGFAGGLSRLAGGLFVAALVAYLVISYRAECRTCLAEAYGEEADEIPPMHLWRASSLLAVGLVALFVGAQLLVSGAVGLARLFGVPETVIGLTLVAVGTSLPELATSVVATVRGHAEVAAGNVLGSNMFNVLGILGLTALVRPVPIDAAVARVDLPLALALSLLVVPVIAGRVRLGRALGGVMLASYAGYVVLRFI